VEPLLELTIIQAAELARISPPTMGPMKTLIGLSRIIVETSTCCMFTVTVNGTTIRLQIDEFRDISLNGVALEMTLFMGK
jgi:hypothetical protein